MKCFTPTVPAAVPGIVFLSGGQCDELATAHLDAINRLGAPLAAQLLLRPGPPGCRRSRLGRASSPTSPLAASFLHRAKLNKRRRSGSYTVDMEKAAS